MEQPLLYQHLDPHAGPVSAVRTAIAVTRNSNIGSVIMSGILIHIALNAFHVMGAWVYFKVRKVNSGKDI